MKKLPIGIQNLREIREGGYCYVDKSPFVRLLADTGKCFFLSRPRRFGKSLFLDTLKEAFEGNRSLFEGLYLENNWDWATKFPVLRFSFGSGVCKSRRELDNRIWSQLEQFSAGPFDRDRMGIPDAFHEVIRRTHAAQGPVVVLVDEYDKPILDNITEPERAIELREGLKNFYSALKDADPFLKFVFLTGVSKFSKVSLFSGLNNLKDLTLDPRCASICGYTEPELVDVFAERLVGKDLAEIRRWYNGYSFLGEAVYNPFDILQYLDLGEFRNFWFESGSPTFLIDLMRRKRFFAPRLERFYSSDALLSSFDVPEVEPETILFQAGYLTIRGVQQVGPNREYLLGWPNLEVRHSLSDALLENLSKNPEKKRDNRQVLLEALEIPQPERLEHLFHAFFASIPHDWYRRNQLDGYEGFYASVVYCYFVALGLEVIPEDVTNHGRIDLTVKHRGRIFLFEFKVKGLAGTGNAGRTRPMTWLKKKNYHEKYTSAGRDVYLIGIEFDPETRNIRSFEWEQPFS